jgi:hypothetical protein
MCLHKRVKFQLLMPLIIRPTQTSTHLPKSQDTRHTHKSKTSTSVVTIIHFKGISLHHTSKYMTNTRAATITNTSKELTHNHLNPQNTVLQAWFAHIAVLQIPQ